MAEEDPEQEEGEEEEEPKGSRLKQFIILAIIVLLGQSAIAYVVVTRLILPKQEVSNGEGEGQVVSRVSSGEREEIPIEDPLLFRFDRILVNLQDEYALRYLSTKVAIELENLETFDELIAEDGIVMVEVKDLIYRTLNQMPVSQTDEAHERKKVRDILRERINASGLLENGEVTAVYFEVFVVQ